MWLSTKLHNISIKLFHINNRSINKNLASTLVLLEQIKQEFDILILTETTTVIRS